MVQSPRPPLAATADAVPLARRVAALAWFAVAANVVLESVDLVRGRDHLVAISALRVLSIVVGIAVGLRLRRPMGHDQVVRVAVLGSILSLVANMAVGIIAQVIFNPTVIAAALPYLTASTFAWGAGPQTIVAAVAAACAMGNVVAVRGLEPGIINFAVAVLIGMPLSILTAATLARERAAREAALADVAASLAETQRARDAALAAARAKAVFLATMSHELRTPMNGILGMTRLALESEMGDEAREHVATVHSSAESLLTVINDVLDFSKIEAGKLSLETLPFGLRRLLDDTLRAFAPACREKGLTLGCDVAPDVPDGLAGDPGRLRQVLVNLLGNAVKFTPEGAVRVTVVREGAEAGGVVLRFAIEDTGIGIAPAELDRVFDAFTQADDSTTRRFGGTGLGLAITRQLVTLMGGTIAAESTPGRGSRFHFTARFGLADVVPAVPAPIVPAPAVRRLRVLLAEDNRVNQLVAIRVLEKRGHAVVVAADGRAAVERALGEPFDLILMDMQMPEMDGLAATAAIRAAETGTGRRVPIVAMTANALEGDRERCLAAGMDDYLAKPIDFAALDRVLARYAAADRAA